MALGRDRKLEIIKEHGLNGVDTGSSQVQIAMLTDRIESLTGHCKINKKDYSTKRGLLKLVCQRRSLLSYLSRKNESAYKALIQKLGLRK